MYVDDVLDSSETVPEAQILRRQLSELLAEAGFKLRKWLSNEAAVIADIPPEDTLSSLKITEEGLPPLKTLGVLWRADKDVFTFEVKSPQANEKTTKIDVLSAIARLFDLQLLVPFTIRAKIIMQETWAAGLNWDGSLPDYLDTKWKAWIAEFPELSLFQIPRCLLEAFPTDLQLHVFSDASKDSYASAAYLVCRYEEGAPTSCLIASDLLISPGSHDHTDIRTDGSRSFNQTGKEHSEGDYSIKDNLLVPLDKCLILGPESEPKIQDIHQ